MLALLQDGAHTVGEESRQVGYEQEAGGRRGGQQSRG